MQYKIPCRIFYLNTNCTSFTSVKNDYLFTFTIRENENYHNNFERSKQLKIIF